MKLTLVRHAEVDERYHGCYNGHNEITLSKKGELQAKELCKLLDFLKFDAVFCSDTLRAKQTLKYSLHVENANFTDRLREKSWGKHEGMKFDEIIAQNEIKYENFLQWIKALDGEDYETYIKRIEKFFLDYLPSLNKEHILVVTHAGVIRVFLSIIHKLSLEDAFSIKVGHAKPIHYDFTDKDFKDAIL
jgi:alpha-ribazole phosphatase/probable phosphoglycerate mutase